MRLLVMAVVQSRIPLGLHAVQDSMCLGRGKFAGFDFEGEVILLRWPWASCKGSESTRGRVRAIEIDRDTTRRIGFGDVHESTGGVGRLTGSEVRENHEILVLPFFFCDIQSVFLLRM